MAPQEAVAEAQEAEVRPQREPREEQDAACKQQGGEPERAARRHEEAAKAEAEASELPAEFQGEVILAYDSQRYPFLEALCQVLDEPPGTDLTQLHKSKLGLEIVGCFQRRPEQVVALGPRGNPWNRRYHSCAQRQPEHFARFVGLYHEFLRTFVLENLRTSRVAFQTSPTFRCHMPGCGAPGRPHRDEDYHHARSEVNYWVPVTPVFGSNSLYAESRRGLGDFRAFEVEPGRAVRFYGNQVWHYTTTNETDSTRVSFDFRVIREEEWSPATFTNFKLGMYYSVMTPTGVLPKSSPEMRRLQEQFQCLPPPKKIKSKPADQAEKL